MTTVKGQELLGWNLKQSAQWGTALAAGTVVLTMSLAVTEPRGCLREDEAAAQEQRILLGEEVMEQRGQAQEDHRSEH